MHNPIRRVKRFKQPVSSSRPVNQLAEVTNGVKFNPIPDEDGHPARHRQAAPPDTLRGAMLVALIVVTIVLYFVLWELERSSFTSVPPPDLVQSAAMAAIGSPSSDGKLDASPARYLAVIVQERPISTSVGAPNLSDDHVPLPSSKLGRATPKTWPPPITHVPEEHDTEDVLEIVDGRVHEDLASWDATYCHGPCRFLLPVRIGEQESKARVHFMQLLALARRLNRTIVLPNVGKSRMSACSEWPFGAYYDMSGFADGRNSSDPDGSLAIDLQAFTEWVHGRPTTPDSFLVSMESIHQDRRDFLGTQADFDDDPFIAEKAEVDPKVSVCLGSKLTRLRSSILETALVISFDSTSLKTGPDASARLVDLLSSSLDLSTDSDFDLVVEPGYEYIPQYANSSHLSLADIDVLVLDYDLRHPLFSASESTLANGNLHYAPELYDLADRLSDNLGPFLGVHWRMENVPAQNLAWCAASLVSTLQALLRDDVKGKDVQHVWLATDYPRPLGSFVEAARFPVDEDRTFDDVGRAKQRRTLRGYGPPRKSSTFKALSLEHDDAIGILAEAFQSGGDLEGWKLTDLAQQLRRYPYIEGRFEVNETLLNDSGVFGILDKLVIVQASVFVSGSKDCSKTSSFSRQVIEARQETFGAERNEGAIRNVVEYFGKG